MTMTLEALIEANLAELLAAPERMTASALSARRLFVNDLAGGRLAELSAQAFRLRPEGLADLYRYALLVTDEGRYRYFRERLPALWLEEREEVAAQIERAFGTDPPLLWAGFFLLILFRDIVVRRVEYRCAPDRTPPKAPSAFVYCMQ